jgi:hypothetical protein
MKKLYLLLVGLCMLPCIALRVSGQTITVPNLAGPYCSGANVTVAYTLSSSYSNNQTFFAELSDVNGNFPGTVIGNNGPTKNSGNISAQFVNSTATSTLYKVRVYSSPAGDTSIPTSAFTINQRPTATYTASPGLNGCIGAIVTYTTQPGQNNYTWTVPGTAGTQYTIISGVITPPATATNSITIVWNTTGNKTVSVNYTDGNTCTSQLNASITTDINNIPTATFTAAPSVSQCVGTAVVYTTQAGQTNYTWTLPGTAGVDYNVTSGTATPVGSATNSITVVWLTSGSKNVKVNYTNSNNCFSAADASNTISVNDRPVATFTAAPATNPCVGTSVTYTTEAGQSNYTWSIPGTAGPDYTLNSGTISPVASATNSITITWNSPGSKPVSVNYSDANTCTSQSPASSTVTANARPAATFSSPAATNVCVGLPVVYTTQAGQTNYTWTLPGTLGVDYNITSGTILPVGSATNSITVVWLTSGSKLVTVNYTDANGCTSVADASKSLTANARPVATFATAPGANACASSPIIYTTQGGGGINSYIWSIPAGATVNSGGTSSSNTVTVTYTGTGSKTVTVNYTDGNGCTSVTPASNTTTLIGVPVFVSGASGSHCQGFTTITFTANSSNGTVNNYSLVTNPIDITTVINSATGAVTFSPTFVGTATITTSAVGCAATASHVENIAQALGTTSFVGASPTACQGSVVDYDATNTGAATIAYSMSPVAAGTINSSTGVVTYNAGFTGTAVITATATPSNPDCVGAPPAAASITVVVTPAVTVPVFNVGPLDTICQNPGSITYTATASNLISPISYSVSPSGAGTMISTTGQLTYNAGFTGTATITATAFGCNGNTTRNFVVTVKSTVAAPVFPSNPTIRKQGGGTVSYGATASFSTGISYALSPAAAGNINSSGLVTFNPTFVGPTATITATAFGCNITPSTNFVVTIVQTPVFTLGGTSTRCQGSGNVTYTATSNNGTVGYSLTTIPNDPTVTVNSLTGVVTYSSGFSGSVIVKAVATNGAVVTDTSFHIITINPAPHLQAPTPTSKIMCSGDSTSLPLVATTGAGSTYSWLLGGGTNITGKATGNQNAINQKLTNTGSQYPDSLWYIVTVTSPPPASCLSIVTDSIKVIVNPKPVLTPISALTICSEANPNISLGASTPLPNSFAWTVSAPAKITGAALGSGNVINQTLINTDVSLPPAVPTAGTVNYFVTPTSQAGCVGNAGTIQVIVNPLPVVVFTSGTSKTICSGTLTNIPLSANLSSSFTYTPATITSLGLISGQASGATALINDTLRNSSNSVVDSIAYNVIATNTSGSTTCIGKPKAVVVRVNPLPVITSKVTDSVCSQSATATPLAASVPSTFEWSIGTVTGSITGQSANPTSSAVSTISQTLTNPSFDTAGFVNYIVIPTSSSLPNCPGSPTTVTVKVNPQPKLTSASTATICSDTRLIYTPTSSVKAGTTIFTYDRTSAVPDIQNKFQVTTTGINDSLSTHFFLTPQNVDYKFLLESAAHCKLDNQHLTVTVNPTPDTPGIGVFPNMKLCVGANSMNFGTSRPPSPLEYFKWSTIGAGTPIQKADSSFSQNALISFPASGTPTVIVESFARGFSCKSKVSSKTIPISNATGNQNVNVAFFANNLVAQAKGVKAYQWGFDRKADLDSVILRGENTQNYDTHHGFDPATYMYWVMVTFADDCVQKAYFNGSLGVQQLTHAAELKLYPNPVQETLTVEVNERYSGKLTFEVYDLTGKRLAQVQSNDIKTNIPVGNFAPGYYTITCTYEGARIATSRFIKN